jgi:GAF domain-containing protein
MQARGHRIRVGQGMIGWSIANQQARVAGEAGGDAVRLATAELPETRAEAALPLTSRGRVIGALTVQSAQEGFFTESTVTVLQTMADQVAVALDNARLFAESQLALEALRRSYGEVSRKEWVEMIHARLAAGYTSDERGVYPVKESDEALSQDARGRGLEIPVKVRDQVLGTLKAAKPAEESEWTEEEVALLEALADQLSVALENARLYESTQRRAERERMLAEITAKVRASTDINMILQTAIQELADALRVSRGKIELHQADIDSEDGGDSDD